MRKYQESVNNLLITYNFFIFLDSLIHTLKNFTVYRKIHLKWFGSITDIHSSLKEYPAPDTQILFDI